MHAWETKMHQNARRRSHQRKNPNLSHPRGKQVNIQLPQAAEKLERQNREFHPQPDKKLNPVFSSANL
jgi:hypothetical protein